MRIVLSFAAIVLPIMAFCALGKQGMEGVAEKRQNAAHILFLRETNFHITTSQSRFFLS